MIPRTLVPPDAKPRASEGGAPVRRRPSSLDERTLIPPALPVVPLDGRTSIPASLPLDSIAARVIVPRDIKWEAIPREERAEAPLLPTDMDIRVTVPPDAKAPEVLEPGPALPSEIVEPDIVTSGEIHLMGEKKERDARWNLVTRFSSGLAHVLVILAVLLQPKMFPLHPARQDDSDLARMQLSRIFLPPDTTPPKVTHPNEPRSDKMRIDPRILRRLAPPEAPPQPLPGPPEPERVVKELPNAPKPQPNVATETPPEAPAPKPDLSRPTAKLEPPDQPQPNRGLVLPKFSPGRAIEESSREAAQNSSRSQAISGPMPGAGRQVPGGGGAPGTGLLTNGVELLTPTEGVDFSNYLARVLASVRQNWYAVMPSSARLGDRGRVVLQFRIMKEGVVPPSEPALLLTSGKEPLDHAAISAIRTSSPFEPLPPAFSGPYIELRFIFLYNLPIDYAQ